MTSQYHLLELQQTLYTSKNPTRRWLHNLRREWIVQALGRYSSRGNQKALEIGPGAGVYLPALAHLFQEVTAIDIENAFLENAELMMERFPNLKLLADDITASKLPPATFDLILCTEVIEHLTHSEVAVKEMGRLLRPSGILILTTPQRFSTLELMSKIAFLPGIINLVRFIYREPILETGHINLMTEKQVTAQLESGGFRLLEHYKSGLYLPLVAEFLGHHALRIEKWLESRLRDRSLLQGLLWTQYFIAES